MDLSVSASLLTTIQLSITPVILITGLGSLLLTMTNRMGRIVDRTRSLARPPKSSDSSQRRMIERSLHLKPEGETGLGAAGRLG